MVKPLSTIILAMASYGDGYEQDSTLMKFASSLLGGSRYILDPDQRAQKVAHLIYSKSPWKLKFRHILFRERTHFLLLAWSAFWVWLGRELQQVIFGKMRFLPISENWKCLMNVYSLCSFNVCIFDYSIVKHCQRLLYELVMQLDYLIQLCIISLIFV